MVILLGVGAVGTAVALLTRAPTLQADIVSLGRFDDPGQRSTGESAQGSGSLTVVSPTTPAPADRPEVPTLTAPAVPARFSAPPTAIILPRHGPWPTDPIGALPDGRLVIPDDPSRVGWWSGGAAPGDVAGSVVLVGHLDSATHGLGVFAALLDVTLGEPLVVSDSSGRQQRYVVSSRTQIPRAALPAQLFDRSGVRQLVLITCGGRYDRTAHRYDDNIVVVARPTD